MTMSIRCDGCGLEYAGAKGAAGVFARPANLLRPRYLRMLAEILRFWRRARALLAAGPEARRGRNPGGIPGAGKVQRLLHGTFHGSGGQRRMVLRPDHRTVVSRALPLCLPGPPRHARHQGLPAVEDGERRIPELRGPRGRRPAGGPSQQSRAGRAAHGPRGRNHDGGRHRGVRRRRHRRPPARGAGHDRRSHAGRNPGAGRHAVHREPHQIPPRPRRAAADRGGPGLLELPAAILRGPPGPRAGQLRPHASPAPPPRGRRQLHRQPRRIRTHRRRNRAAGPRLRAPPVHAGVRRSPGQVWESSAIPGSPSPAPTTAGVSTRTEQPPVSGRQHGWAGSGKRPPQAPVAWKPEQPAELVP